MNVKKLYDIGSRCWQVKGTSVLQPLLIIVSLLTKKKVLQNLQELKNHGTGPGVCTIKLLTVAITDELLVKTSHIYSWSLYYKTFYGGNLRIFLISQTRVKHLLGAPLQGRPLALPTNIRLGWKGLPGTNTLAHYKNL